MQRVRQFLVPHDLVVAASFKEPNADSLWTVKKIDFLNQMFDRLVVILRTRMADRQITLDAQCEFLTEFKSWFEEDCLSELEQNDYAFDSIERLTRNAQVAKSLLARVGMSQNFNRENLVELSRLTSALLHCFHDMRKALTKRVEHAKIAEQNRGQQGVGKGGLSRTASYNQNAAQERKQESLNEELEQSVILSQRWFGFCLALGAGIQVFDSSQQSCVD